MDLSDVARRRMHLIACHIGAVQCNPCSVSSRTSLATLVCSSGSGTLSGSRKDNRLLYSRQGSHTQAFYMHQSTGSQLVVSNEEGCMDSQQVIDKYSGGEVKQFFPAQEWQHREPLFSKPVSDVKNMMEYGELPSVEGVPLFARRADDGDVKVQTAESKKKQSNNENIGLEWYPRMDIVESGSAYVVTVELPGVDAESIRVEVSSNRLIITGTRSTEWWLNLTKVNRSAIYHCRELSQGPYRVVWHIPRDGNVDFITAEFIDGFLRILVPKSPA